MDSIRSNFDFLQPLVQVYHFYLKELSERTVLVIILVYHKIFCQEEILDNGLIFKTSATEVLARSAPNYEVHPA